MQGVSLILMGILLGAVTGAFRRLPNQRRVRGVVTAVEEAGSAGRRPAFRAIVEYHVQGTTFLVRSGRASPSFRPGQQRWIAYDSLDPQRAILCPAPMIYAAMLLLTAAGVISCALSYLGQVG